MDYYKVLISIPDQDIGDIKWPLTQEQYVALATGNKFAMPADMHEVFACPRSDLECTAVWDPVQLDWVVPVDAATAAVMYTEHGRVPGPW